MGQEKNLHEMEIKKPDLQMMIQDFAAAQRLFADERRNFEKRITEEREMARWREERIRQEYEDKSKRVEGQVRALLTLIEDLKRENIHLYEELVAARPRKNEDVDRVVWSPPAQEAIPTKKMPVVKPPENIKKNPWEDVGNTGGSK